MLPPLECTCNTRGTAVAKEEKQRLVKFLEGLNESYKSVYDKIMMFQPLPDIERAYELVVHVEDRKMLNVGSVDSGHLMGMNVGHQTKNHYPKVRGYKHGLGPYKKRLTKEEKRRLKCTHCLESSLEIEECFKLHGVPEWYRKYKENRMQNRVNMVENEDDAMSSHGGMDQRKTSGDINKLIQS